MHLCPSLPEFPPGNMMMKAFYGIRGPTCSKMRAASGILFLSNKHLSRLSCDIEGCRPPSIHFSNKVSSGMPDDMIQPGPAAVWKCSSLLLPASGVWLSEVLRSALIARVTLPCLGRKTTPFLDNAECKPTR